MKKLFYFLLIVLSASCSVEVEESDDQGMSDGSAASLISSNKKKGSIEILKFCQGTEGGKFNYAIIKNFGNKSADEINEKLSKYGWALKEVQPSTAG